MNFNITDQNFDLLTVGVAIAAIALLGFGVFFNNRKSLTNQSFLYLAIATIFWGLSNYLEYKFTTTTSALWALRTHLFISIFHAFAFFQFAFVFPNNTLSFPKWFKYFLVPVVILTAIMTLTPLIFSRVAEIAPAGLVTKAEVGPAIILFMVVAFGLLIGGIISLLKKVIYLKGIEKRQTIFISIGMFVMACLILLFNVVLPITFSNLTYIPYAALFVLPFIALASYTIYKHKLFNIQNLATVIISFALTIVTFVEVIFANTVSLLLFRVCVFILVLIFSIRLVKNMISLENANGRLKELDQMKTEFVSLATHQIRAPLTGIKGYISLIQEGDYGPVTPQISEAIGIIFNETNALVTIVGDFLDVSRIEQGRMKYEVSDFNLEELVTEVNRDYKPNVEKKGLQFFYDAEPGQVFPLTADRGKLKQVIGNIIDNSIKYTPKGSITVLLKKVEGAAHIIIKDTGVGIPQGTLPKLFQKFTRASNANETNILGTGLGLYVAKNMVESMNGKIWAQSEGEGKGSEFHIQLPLRTGASKPALAAEDKESAFKPTP
jgi:signal transduction histidine kinase